MLNKTIYCGDNRTDQQYQVVNHSRVNKENKLAGPWKGCNKNQPFFSIGRVGRRFLRNLEQRGNI